MIPYGNWKPERRGETGKEARNVYGCVMKDSKRIRADS
jgi:hypothetical protein